MDKRVNSFERLEYDTHQIKIDLAVLTARAETFATQKSLTELAARIDNCATKEMLAEQSACIEALNVRADTFATKSELLKLATRDEVTAIRDEMTSLRVGLYKGLTNQIRWLTACMFTVAGLSLAAAKLLFN